MARSARLLALSARRLQAGQARAVSGVPPDQGAGSRRRRRGSRTPLLQEGNIHSTGLGWGDMAPVSGLVKGGCRQSGNDDLEGFLRPWGLEENLSEKQSDPSMGNMQETAKARTMDGNLPCSWHLCPLLPCLRIPFNAAQNPTPVGLCSSPSKHART
jgi:hypothetical protein